MTLPRMIGQELGPEEERLHLMQFSRTVKWDSMEELEL